MLPPLPRSVFNRERIIDFDLTRSDRLQMWEPVTTDVDIALTDPISDIVWNPHLVFRHISWQHVADFQTLLFGFQTLLCNVWLKLGHICSDIRHPNFRHLVNSECLKSKLVWISESSVVSHSQTVPISNTLKSGHFCPNFGHFFLSEIGTKILGH